MSQYQLTKQARGDLIGIRRYTLEHWGAPQSVSYLSDLRKTLRLLAEMPLMGKSCFNDFGSNIYRFPFASHTIYYFIMSEQRIVIATILHQSMVPENHMDMRL